MKFFCLVLLVTCLFNGAVYGQQTDYRLVVAQDGTGEYRSIQKAIDSVKAFPARRITLYIKSGIYKEKVVIPHWNTQLSLIGENEMNTVITYNDHFKKINRGRNSTFFTATLNVQANDIIVENLTIENSAGDVGQAIALAATGDRGVYKNIQLLGNQDTLYVGGEGTRLYFNQCYIEGSTDFIFGSAIAVFESCQIHAKKESYISAASTHEGQAHGLVFMQSKFTADRNLKNVYLGRPWRPYAQTVLINCHLGKHIHHKGWSQWGDTKPSKAQYAEFNSSGPGASPENRISWSHQLSRKAAKRYTKENILLKDNDVIWFNK